MTFAKLSRDDRLAAILADLSEQQQRGLPAAIDTACREHADLADELRALWATAQFAAFALPPGDSPTLPHTPLEPMPPPDSFGDYEVLEEIGRGGMGVVYKARQKSLDRIVAIKMMREARLSSESDRGRFLAEAESAARLKHPNIVTVYEVGNQNGLPFIVMEFVEGRNLSQRLSEGPMQPRQAARLVAVVARAVQQAHERGILHRDLKPANILLGKDEGGRMKDETMRNSSFILQPSSLQAKVTDFGLAKRLTVSPDGIRDWRTQTGAIVGTPGYMAPEQATGRKDLTPATDVYALGAILYECLTGRPPFLATNPIDALMMVVEQEPVPPRMLTAGIERELEMICLKCLQKPPELRYATSAEFAADLEAYLAGEAVSSQPSGLSYFLSRMLRETHHIGVLENWGLLWIWHSLATFVLCLLTQVLAWSKVTDHTTYLLMWSIGLIAWGTILWRLRRRAGPVLFVERQLAHAWAAGVCASIAMFVIERVMQLPVLTLSPALAVAAGMVFVFKAGILSGRFYVTAAGLFLTATIMPLVPAPLLLFGMVTSASFLIPGIKYYRLRRKASSDLGARGEKNGA